MNVKMAKQETSIVAPIRTYVREHPFLSVVGLWGTVLAGTIGYLYKRNMPTQLKIIQGRIVAQAFLLAGAGMAAGYHFLYEEDKPRGNLPRGHTPHITYKKYDLPPAETEQKLQ